MHLLRHSRPCAAAPSAWPARKVPENREKQRKERTLRDLRKQEAGKLDEDEELGMDLDRKQRWQQSASFPAEISTGCTAFRTGETCKGHASDRRRRR
ncbi:hypothetical protein BHE74_00002748 [Ensete ventricosum]|nr:hypothetical protein GW17_00000384 [Ensete ventricosum]RWW88370.1 hypothetical protein BHE74_00002748 [Ensete ventricosum]